MVDTVNGHAAFGRLFYCGDLPVGGDEDDFDRRRYDLQIERRLATLEAQYHESKKWRDAVDTKIDRIDGRLEELVAAANMAKGGWWTLVKLSLALMALISAVGTVGGAAYWALNHIAVRS